MEKRAFNDWDEATPEQIAGSFEAQWPEGARLIFANYTYQDYSGEALVIYEQGGVYYRVTGAHCSCYGLEDQWEPEETNLALELKWAEAEVSRERGRWDDPLTEADTALVELLKQELGQASK